MLKKISKYIITSFILFLIPLLVYAEDGLVLSVSDIDLEAGEEVEVTAILPDDVKLYAFIASLKYDENVFERLDSEDFTSNSSSVDISFSENTNKFGLINKKGKVSGDLFTITLKVKDDAKAGDTNIALTNISASDGKKTIPFDSVTASLKVTRDALDDEVITNNEANTIVEDNEEIIKVFSNRPIIYALSILFIALLGVIIYLLIKYRDKKIIIIVLSVGELIVLGILGVLISLNLSKKDVNNDGVKDYNDAKEIIDYLINIESKEETEKTNNKKPSTTNKQNNSEGETSSKEDNNSDDNSNSNENPNIPDLDTNNDGKVDVNDAGHVAEEVKTTVKVTDASNNEDYYTNKGDIVLNFKADITPSDVKLYKVMINGEYYDVSFDGDIYSVKIVSPTEPGIHKFKMTKVFTDNDKEIDVNLTFEREVLKDIPAVSNFSYDNDSKSLKFEILDEDEVFEEGYALIYNNKDEEIKKETVFVGQNEIKDLELEEKKEYSIIVKASYDLDSDKNNDQNNYIEEIIFDHGFMLLHDYNFTLTNASITDSLTPGEYPIVSFMSSNRVNANVETAMIKVNDKEAHEYVITKKDGDNYEVELTNADISFGKHTVFLESVELSTLKSFKNTEDYQVNTLTYNVLKRAPKAENIKVTNDSTNKKVNVSFKLTDEDETFDGLTIVLVDSAGKIIDQRKLTNEEIKDHESHNSGLELSYKNGTDGYYTVRFLADYTLGDKYKYTNQNIGEEVVITNSPQDLYVQSFELPKNIYLSKGQKGYQIILNIFVGKNIKQYNIDKYGTGNAYQDISSVTINNINYITSSSGGASNNEPEDGVFKTYVTIAAPNESGVIDLNVSRVQFRKSSYYVKINDFFTLPESKTIQVEVLKDAPHIENLKVVEEDYEKGKVTFEFDVVLDKKATLGDESFKEGTISLNGESQDIERGHNKITFEGITPDQDLDLIFKASYDLDTDSKISSLPEDTDLNEYKNVEIHKVTYGLYKEDKYTDVNITDVKSNKEVFEKGEDIKITFASTGLDDTLSNKIQKVMVNKDEYAVTKVDNQYVLDIPGFVNAGLKNFKITDIILTNGKTITLKEPVNINIEVLKDAVSVNDYHYDVNEEDIKVFIHLKDNDSSIVGKPIVTITDDQGKTLYNEEYDKDHEEITIPKEDEVLRYYVVVKTDYRRSQNKEDYHQNYELLSEVISLDNNNIDLKNIMDVHLYYNTIENEEEVVIRKDTIDIEHLKQNKEDYFIEVNMENMPSIRARIKEVKVFNNHLYVIPDSTYFQNETGLLEIDLGEIGEGVVVNETDPELAFASLMAKLRNNENVTLTHDYDFKNISDDNKTYVDNYTGILDGNGHKIKNLNKPLFNTINNGTVQNLVLENTILGSTDHGSLANTVTSATIKNVITYGVSKLSNSEHQNGGLIGTAQSKSVILECKAINVTLNVSDRQQNGALIGRLDNSTINNCYADGTINGSYNFNAVFVGNAVGNSVITNSIAVGSASGDISCDFACTYASNASYKNNLILGTGGTKAVFVDNKNNDNNYYVTDKEVNQTGVNTITKEDINDALFKEKLQFDGSIWRIRNTSYLNLPTLQKEKISDFEENEPEKITLYNNLAKLMPYYDNNKIKSEAAKIKEDSNLYTKELMHIVPLTDKGSLVTYLTKDNLKNISKLKLVYKDGTKEEYKVTYDKTYEMVASYRIKGLDIDYNYKNYLIDTNSQLVINLTNYLKSLDYTNNLDILTSTDDSRIYRDFYNNVTKGELKEFVLKYLANSNYTNTLNDDGINNFIEKEIKKDQKLEKVLYMYNYLRRFYDVSIDGMKLYDFVLFNMEGFDKILTPLEISELYLSNSSNFNTADTNGSYIRIFKSYTKLNNMAKFLEYMVTEFGDGDLNKWVNDEFNNILLEIPIKGHEKDIEYTLWDHFSNPDKGKNDTSYTVYNYILPILTLPENSTYIISSPVQFVIGSIRGYIEDPTNPSDMAFFDRKINSYAERIETYFETAYGILEDKTLFNNIHTYHLDKRYTKNEYGATVYNQPYVTEEPFHKNFNEVVGKWAHSDGNAAVAYGDRIEWSAEGFMDGNLIPEDGDLYEYTFHTFTHETAHNIDARLFLKDNGRRFDAGGEDYADSNLMQSFGVGDFVMNLSRHFEPGTKIASNLDPSRIDTPAEIHDYYKKLFNVIYIMDYIEGKAFLQLDSAHKSYVGMKVSYPNEDNPENVGAKEYLQRQWIRYSELKPEDFDGMTLNDIEDLYDNHLTIYPGIYQLSSRGTNSYGGQNIFNVHWYQPHNDKGRPDSYSIKWFAYEMLGYAGYDGGYIKYYSNIDSINTDLHKNYKTDLMALQAITGKESFRDYKLGRFEEIEEKLPYLVSDINVKEYVQKLYEALYMDGEQADTNMKIKLEKSPNCFSDYWCTRRVSELRSFPYSQKVREEIFYTLKNLTNDFTTDFFENYVVQSIDNLSVDKNFDQTKYPNFYPNP